MDPIAAPTDASQAKRRVIHAWAMYDWANSAFATTVMAAVFGPFYRSLVTGAGLGEAEATAFWAYTNAAGLLLVALLGPVLGAVADFTGNRKRYLGFFLAVGTSATAGMALLGDVSYIAASATFLTAVIGFACANIFYDSFLPGICGEDEIDRVSARGYALGYAGGAILLIVNALWISFPESFGLPGRGFAARASFVSVAIWWAAFSIPFFRHVPEPPVAPRPVGLHPVRGGFRRLGHTFRSLRNFRQLLLFLIAFWIYNDGVGTILRMATAYGDEIGLDLRDMIAALVLSQVIGVPFAFLFGRLAGRFGTKRMILAALVVYCGIAVAGLYLRTALDFYLLAAAVGTVQGGVQALSRSLYGMMVPRRQAAEFFGFFATSDKFAGILGPLLFGVVSQFTGSSRLSILSLIAFFVIGGAILMRVDVEEGKSVARREDKTFA